MSLAKKSIEEYGIWVVWWSSEKWTSFESMWEGVSERVKGEGVGGAYRDRFPCSRRNRLRVVGVRAGVMAAAVLVRALYTSRIIDHRST